MLFNDAPHIQFSKTPLKQVICQFRFLPILKIEEEPPANFQDKIITNFPRFKEVKQNQISVQFGSLPISIPTQSDIRKHYEFQTKDEVYKLVLNRDSISLTANEKYSGWQVFWGYFENILNDFYELYQPNIFSRIGLRYIDIFDREYLGYKKNTPWGELFKSEFLGLLASNENDIKGLNSVYEFNKDTIKIRTLLALVRNNISADTCIQLDTDCSIEKELSFDEAKSVVNDLHNFAYKVFYNSMTQEFIESHKSL